MNKNKERQQENMACNENHEGKCTDRFDTEEDLRFYVIDRYRAPITLQYVEENLKYFRRFGTFQEANQHLRSSFFDDSDYGVFYRTCDNQFLRVVSCLE